MTLVVLDTWYVTKQSNKRDTNTDPPISILDPKWHMSNAI